MKKNSDVTSPQGTERSSVHSPNTGKKSLSPLYKKSERFLKKLLKENLPKDCRYFLFGSRAKGDFSFNSDIDIGIMDHTVDYHTIIKLKEIIDESFVPYKVDIIDFSKAKDSFKQEALKHIIPWN